MVCRRRVRGAGVWAMIVRRAAIEFHQNVPKSIVDSMMWNSNESIAALIAERKRLGIWKPATCKTQSLTFGLDSYLKDAVANIQYQHRGFCKSLTEDLVKRFACNEDVAKKAISRDRKRRGIA